MEINAGKKLLNNADVGELPSLILSRPNAQAVKRERNCRI